MSHKILIIDDDIDLIEAAQIILEANDFEVASSTTTENIKQLVLDEKPDLILLDVMFPESPTEGFEVCRKLKKDPDTKKIPIILLSAINQKFSMAFTANVREKNKVPCECFIEKPVDPTTLIGTIKQYLP